MMKWCDEDCDHTRFELRREVNTEANEAKGRYDATPNLPVNL